jgi:hypothetical protein
MAHIDVSGTAYLLVGGNAQPDASGLCTCRDRTNPPIYGEIYFATDIMSSAYSGRRVAEIVVRAINEAVRQGLLPPEES